MRLRSLLFMPADRPERFTKAAASGADALILDLEDSVVPDRKAAGREAVARWLAADRHITTFVRVNHLGSEWTADDLQAVMPGQPDGIMLPKAEGAASVRALMALMGGASTPVLPIATETPAAIFELGSYGAVGDRLAGLTWGAEDLPAAIGASTARETDGRYTPPYEMVRSLTLFAAHAAGTLAIETVYPKVDDADGLAAYVARARRDGFVGMMAIHPRQVAIINDGFTPTAADMAEARAIIDAFDGAPEAGALLHNGRMIDRPHLVQARRILGLS
ncbi:CoA ester lyase [Sphingobium sp. CR2-8]|uniref:HpcH/HpaI aldolase/citrate lyase family protein n=1 Tax=Sphingobium sp. CR2-8 TaxID=1306534 RepID=UPI002DBFC605|nr:CoA ester lyase [Sphingobium sp. CR2-8]MEC3909333.1 CoA ester lyase [Sphingobium sp. CR2-8]